MEPAAPRSAGLLHSLRALGDGVLGLLVRRLELFSLELHEEKLRLLRLLLWSGVAVVAGGLALVFASLALVTVFWETARFAVLGGLAGFYVALLGACLLALRRHFTREEKPFAGTLGELRRDRACFRDDH